MDHTLRSPSSPDGKRLLEARTKIVATLGPASSSPSVIKNLILSGVDVARLNMAHGSHAEHSKRIDLFRAMAKKTDSGCGILMDLPGPKLRVSNVSGGALELKRNDPVILCSKAGVGGKNVITISYRNLVQDVQKNEAVYICDGLIRIHIEGIQGDKIRGVCTHGGIVHPGNGVNLPHSSLTMKAFTAADQHHLKFGLRKDIDFVGLSFVGSAADIQRVRSFCRAQGKSPFLIAKIERRLALENLEEIIQAADGVMVARGDLGIEEPFFKVPVIQGRIVTMARRYGKPVIVATQVLESMIQNPRPTRAEATDVANAISQAADAVMLSGESAVGKYPVEAVRALSEIIRESEASVEYSHIADRQTETEPKKVIAHEACRIAEKIEAKFILVQSQTGQSAGRIARYRPRVPILAFVDDEKVRQRVSIVWGVKALIRSIKVSMYQNAYLNSWLSRRYQIRKTDRVIYVDTPVDTGKIVLSVIEG